MKPLVQFKRFDGTLVWVDADYVVLVEPDVDYQGATRLTLDPGVSFTVIGLAEDVVAQLRVAGEPAPGYPITYVGNVRRGRPDWQIDTETALGRAPGPEPDE